MTEFEEIYRTYFNDVYRYIRKLSGSESTAEEITSETFFRAMRSIDRFRGDCDIRVWLCQIARNCYLSWLKKGNQTASVDESELLGLPSEEATAEELCIQKDDAARIRTLIHAMREPYREVFLWRVFGELSFQEIGQLFGKTDNWACVTFHRAKSIIKQGLEDNSK